MDISYLVWNYHIIKCNEPEMVWSPNKSEKAYSVDYHDFELLNAYLHTFQ